MVLNYDETIIKDTTSTIDKQFWDYFEATPETNATSSVPSADPSRDQTAVMATYCFLFVFGALGNMAVFATLAKTRRRTRVDLLMTHLTIADLCVTCGVIPLEIAWKYTNAWLAGNCMCKLLMVVRAFGLYLSSNILVCISVDRFFAVVYPLRQHVAWRRSKQMLCAAWLVALACSLPQSLVFRVLTHPHVPGFEQCVSFGAFSTDQQETAYTVFCVCAMYFVPLITITVCYLSIFTVIHRNSKEVAEITTPHPSVSPVRLRRSDPRMLERARRRTLRMTVTIVAVFALCWLPYAAMALWYMIDRASTALVSAHVQDLLFAMAVSNSCVNPLLYGSYALDLRGVARRMFRNTCCCPNAKTDTTGNLGSVSSKNKQQIDVPLINRNGRVRPRLGVRFAETSLTALPDPHRRPPA